MFNLLDLSTLQLVYRMFHCTCACIHNCRPIELAGPARALTHAQVILRAWAGNLESNFHTSIRCKLLTGVGRDRAPWDFCAHCRKKDKFQLVVSHTIMMHQHGLRDNVALLVLLQTTAGDAPWPTSSQPGQASETPQILIANTHVLFNPKRGDIKVTTRLPLDNCMCLW